MKLNYKPLSANGDRIMDYSHAGYMGGGVALPVVPAAQTVMPSGGDDTASIQAALDATAQRPLAGGFRGAVVLAAGVFHASAPLRRGGNDGPAEQPVRGAAVRARGGAGARGDRPLSRLRAGEPRSRSTARSCMDRGASVS